MSPAALSAFTGETRHGLHHLGGPKVMPLVITKHYTCMHTHIGHSTVMLSHLEAQECPCQRACTHAHAVPECHRGEPPFHLS